MKTVLTLLSVLVAVHIATAATAAAGCSSLKQFDTTFVPACDPNDLYILWPNYENQTTYYKCNGVNSRAIADCPAGQYFTYVMQRCETCVQYIPPVYCYQLKTQNPPNCYAIGSEAPGSSTAAPPTASTAAPTTASTAAPPTASTAAPTTASTAGPPVVDPSTSAPPTPPGPPGPSDSTDIPAPPGPSTVDPDIPQPPTPPPTPPTQPAGPPIIGT